jgi:hypothetical protein
MARSWRYQIKRWRWPRPTTRRPRPTTWTDARVLMLAGDGGTLPFLRGYADDASDKTPNYRAGAVEVSKPPKLGRDKGSRDTDAGCPTRQENPSSCASKR